MKNFWLLLGRLLSIIIITFILTGCTDYGTMPHSVKFPKEGGPRNLYCEGGAYFIQLDGKYADQEELDKGDYTLKGEWVTINIRNHGIDWEIITSPNTTRKSRSVYVHYSTVPDNFPDLKIIQKK